MRDFAILPALIVVTLAGCVGRALPGEAVQDERAAVAMGQKVCREAEAGAKAVRPTPINDWHAHLSRDVWDVWFGKREHGLAYMEVWIAARDGRTMQQCIVE